LDLISRAQAGDREAFAALFEQHKNLVYKTAYLLLGDIHEAEDALQEVFLSVHKSLISYDARKGAFTTWLYRVTLNFCLNHRRRKSPASLEDMSPMPAVHIPVAKLAEEDALWRATRSLSDRQQVVIVLRYYWDLPYAEIASILDIPLGTVKSRLDLALKSLRKIMEEQEHGNDSISRAEVCE
jgi:RNA polymerase sigma-70 factor (ECF subfamily)